MFIRQTKTSNSSSGQSYFTYGLVSSRPVGKQVKQQRLLNLGRHFELPGEQWPELCIRLEQILSGQKPLFEPDEVIEQTAQHLYSKLIARSTSIEPEDSDSEPTDFQEVELNSIEMLKPRSVGAEHACLETLRQLNLPAILNQAGLNTAQKAAAVGNIVARMCQPARQRTGYLEVAGKQKCVGRTA